MALPRGQGVREENGGPPFGIPPDLTPYSRCPDQPTHHPPRSPTFKKHVVSNQKKGVRKVRVNGAAAGPTSCRGPWQPPATNLQRLDGLLHRTNARRRGGEIAVKRVEPKAQLAGVGVERCHSAAQSNHHGSPHSPLTLPSSPGWRGWNLVVPDQTIPAALWYPASTPKEG